MRLRTGTEWINALTTAWCRLRSSRKIISTESQLPASDCVAASTSLLVTPLIAETTTTTSLSREAARMISSTFWIADASPTEVPPNFMIRSGVFTVFEDCLVICGFHLLPQSSPTA